MRELFEGDPADRHLCNILGGVILKEEKESVFIHQIIYLAFDWFKSVIGLDVSFVELQVRE